MAICCCTRGGAIFLRKILEGPAERSYGIQVARLAGVPESIVRRARDVLQGLEGTEPAASSEPTSNPRPHRVKRKAGPQMGLFGEEPAATDPLPESKAQRIQTELATVDINNLTPLQALNMLAQWKGWLR